MEKFLKPNFTMSALVKLCPGAEFALQGEELQWQSVLDSEGNPTGDFEVSNVQWFSDIIKFPTKQEIDNAILEEENKWASSEYQRLRRQEYPPLADLADALYWQAQGDDSKMTAYLAAVEAVKQKYPKGV